jgi:hypothetical protein
MSIELIMCDNCGTMVFAKDAILIRRNKKENTFCSDKCLFNNLNVQIISKP